MGYTDDVAKLLADSTFLVHTADKEGCPNAVMEAMACGRPVVCTDAGDAASLIDDGKTGFLVGRNDEQLLINRVQTLVQDRNLCCSMGKAARAKAEREFGLDRLVSNTLDVYCAAGWQYAQRDSR